MPMLAILENLLITLLMFLRFMIFLFCGICCSIKSQPVENQDSVISNIEELKKVFIVRKSEPELPIQASLNISESKKSVLENENPKIVYKSTPVMVADKDGLMNTVELKPNSSLSILPKNESYVVLSFKINQLGFVSEINIFDSNDRAFVDLLIHKLGKTVWKPAIDKDDNRADFLFKNWIAKTPSKVKQPFYENLD